MRAASYFALAAACCAAASAACAAAVSLTADSVEVVAARKPYGTTRLAVEEMTNALSRAFGMFSLVRQ